MIMMILILLPLAAACAGYLICRSGGSGRYYYVLLGSTVLEFAAAVFAALGGSAALNIPLTCGLGISLKLDGFFAVYGLILSFMWMMAAALSRQYFAGQTRLKGNNFAEKYFNVIINAVKHIKDIIIFGP